MAGDGFEAYAVLRYKSNPYDVSKCKAKIGLDKGVHFRVGVAAPLNPDISQVVGKGLHFAA
jgi:hypothetical protein